MVANNQYPPAIESLIEALNGLPGIGKRTAERIAVAMLKWPQERATAFGEIMLHLHKNIGFCYECGNLAEAGKVCRICTATNRDRGLICIVEEFTQISSLEHSAVFHGLYHVLGGKLAPLSNRMADSLAVEPLLKRIRNGGIREVILALSQNVEGQATASYITGLLQEFPIKITRLARGLPAGSDIAYADAATLGAAINGRIAINSPEK